MVAAIVPSPTPSAPAQSARSSPSLDAALRTYRAQLADWVTCPSAKTPEGKAIIAKISDKLESVKAEMKQTDGARSALAIRADTPGDAAQQPIASGDGLRAPARAGALLDTYA